MSEVALAAAAAAGMVAAAAATTPAFEADEATSTAGVPVALAVAVTPRGGSLAGAWVAARPTGETAASSRRWKSAPSETLPSSRGRPARCLPFPSLGSVPVFGASVSVRVGLSSPATATGGGLHGASAGRSRRVSGSSAIAAPFEAFVEPFLLPFLPGAARGDARGDGAAAPFCGPFFVRGVGRAAPRGVRRETPPVGRLSTSVSTSIWTDKEYEPPSDWTATDRPDVLKLKRRMERPNVAKKPSTLM